MTAAAQKRAAWTPIHERLLDVRDRLHAFASALRDRRRGGPVEEFGPATDPTPPPTLESLGSYRGPNAMQEALLT